MIPAPCMVIVARLSRIYYCPPSACFYKLILNALGRFNMVKRNLVPSKYEKSLRWRSHHIFYLYRANLDFLLKSQCTVGLAVFPIYLKGLLYFLLLICYMILKVFMILMWPEIIRLTKTIQQDGARVES